MDKKKKGSIYVITSRIIFVLDDFYNAAIISLERYNVT